MIIKSGKYWLRIDPHRTQSPVRFNFVKLFLEVVYVCIFQDSLAIAFQYCGAPKVISGTSGALNCYKIT